jgi:hypothetical protein
MAMLRLKRVGSLVVGLLCWTLLVACSSGQNSLGDATGSTCPSDSTLTYDNFGQAFFATNCNSCHGVSQSPSFGTQADIQANATDIDRAAASGPKGTNTYMPQDGDVATAERAKLGEWLACGAP